MLWFLWIFTNIDELKGAHMNQTLNEWTNEWAIKKLISQKSWFQWESERKKNRRRKTIMTPPARCMHLRLENATWHPLLILLTLCERFLAGVCVCAFIYAWHCCVFEIYYHPFFFLAVSPPPIAVRDKTQTNREDSRALFLSHISFFSCTFCRSMGKKNLFECVLCVRFCKWSRIRALLYSNRRSKNACSEKFLYIEYDDLYTLAYNLKSTPLNLDALLYEFWLWHFFHSLLTTVLRPIHRMKWTERVNGKKKTFFSHLVRYKDKYTLWMRTNERDGHIGWKKM